MVAEAVLHAAAIAAVVLLSRVSFVLVSWAAKDNKQLEDA